MNCCGCGSSQYQRINSIWLHNCRGSSRTASLQRQKRAQGGLLGEVSDSAATCRACGGRAVCISRTNRRKYLASSTGDNENALGKHTLQGQCPQNRASCLQNCSVLEVLLNDRSDNGDSTLQHHLVYTVL